MNLKLITDIIAYSLLFLGIAWLYWSVVIETRQVLWQHLKSGILYKFIGRCLMKNPITQQWINAVVYIKDEQIFVVEESEFFRDFTQVKTTLYDGNECKCRIPKVGK